MAPSSENARPLLWRASLAVLSGSAAILLGALYGLGASVESARLASAHVAVLDALPLIPLPHLLTAGISLLLSTVATILLVALFVTGLYRLKRNLESEAWRPLLARRKRKRNTRVMMIRHERDVAKEETDRLTTLRERVQRFNDESVPPPNPTNDVERAAARQLLARGQQLIVEAKDQKQARERTLSRLKALQRTTRIYPIQLKVEKRLLQSLVAAIKYGPVLIALIAACFVPYPIGIGLIVAGGAWRLALSIDADRYVVATLAAIVSVGVVANGIINVSPLPIAELRADSISRVGPLVALTDSTWYIVAQRGAIRPIPAARVEEGVVRPIKHPPTKSLAELVVDIL